MELINFCGVSLPWPVKGKKKRKVIKKTRPFSTFNAPFLIGDTFLK